MKPMHDTKRSIFTLAALALLAAAPLGQAMDAAPA